MQTEPAPGSGGQRKEAAGAGEQTAPSLELLVHGVGGSTPGEMLGGTRTERVTGDRTAAVHRRAEDVAVEGTAAGARAVPEAYCWSPLTSGNSARALWLLLLPFMVANLAHWMRPEAGSGSRHERAVRAHGVLGRLLALSLTVLLVAAACEVALDLVAWQCAGSPRCAAEQPWLGFLAPGAGGHGGWWSTPGRRLALAAVVPTALTALLWWLSRRTWSAYESEPPWRTPTGAGGEPAGAGRPALADPGFWYGRRTVARLRAAHTAAGLLTVATALTTAATRYDRGVGGSAALETLGWVVGALSAACGLWVGAAVCFRGRGEDDPDAHREGPVVRLLPGTAASVLALAVLYAGFPRPGWESTGRLPGGEVFGVLTLAQGLLVAGLAVIGMTLHRATRVPRTALAGLGGASTAMLACALGGVMSGGVAQRVADWLDGPAAPGTGPLPGPPTVLTWQASVTPLLLAMVLALLCGHAVRVWRTGRGIAEDVHLHYPGAEPDPGRSRRIGRAVAAARVTDSAPRLVGAFACAALLLGGAAVCGSVLTGQVPGEVTDGAPAVLDGPADAAQALGSWLMGLGFVLLITLGGRAYRDASTRRTVGILWDVGTFWPRAAHPFAPPCYAERAVPDLVWRMATWTRRHEDGRLVLSGHSQGSVLAAAAVWQLDPQTRGQVALLTYGSPLARLYGRWFPAYFGPGPLRALHGELDCWRNLWRATDPIGGPVRLPDAEGPDVDRGPLLDPLFYGRSALSPLPAPLLGHGEYQAHPAFAEERARLLARLGARAGAGESGAEDGVRLPGQTPATVTRDAAPRDAGPQDAAGRSSG